MIKTKSGIIRQDLIILLKLLRIFTLIILRNSGLENLWLAKVKEKEVDNQVLSSIIHSRDLVPKQGGNLIILTFLMMFITYLLISHYYEHIFV